MKRHSESNTLQGKEKYFPGLGTKKKRKEKYYNSDVRMVNNSFVWNQNTTRRYGLTDALTYSADQKGDVWPSTTQVQKRTCLAFLVGGWVGRKATAFKFIQGFTELLVKSLLSRKFESEGPKWYCTYGLGDGISEPQPGSVALHWRKVHGREYL